MRKTKEDTELTRLNILKACYEVVNEKGFEKMTRDDIARKLGMTRGAVNWHFKNKEDIYLMTLEYVMDLLREDREAYFNNTNLPVMGRLLGLFMLPIKQTDYFHFVNRIPHYLLTEEQFAEIERRKQVNREEFIHYMEECLNEFEKEQHIVLKNSKEKTARILYLLYEGLHNRNTSESFQSIDFMDDLPKYLEILMQ